MDYTVQEIEAYFIIIGILSTLSILGSCLIIGVYIYFPDIRAFTFKLVVYLATADLLYSSSNPYSAYLLPLYATPSVCLPQAILITYSSVSIVFWTSSIPLTLYLVLVSNRSNIPKYDKYYLLAGFIFPIIIALLPLTTDSYHRNETETLRCWITPGDRTSDIIWRSLSFYLPMWVIVVWYFYAYKKIVRAIKNDVFLRKFEHEGKIIFIRRLYLYPLVSICCYTVSTTLHILMYVDPKFQNFYVSVINSSLNNISGILHTVIYLYNPIIRAKLFRSSVNGNESSYHSVYEASRKLDDKSFMERASGVTGATTFMND